jgi:NADPH2 dehydrogenase
VAKLARRADLARRRIFANELNEIGYDYVCVSSGGISPQARIAVAPGYQVPFAEAVKKASGIAVRAVGMIAERQRFHCLSRPALYFQARIAISFP